MKLFNEDLAKAEHIKSKASLLFDLASLKLAEQTKLLIICKDKNNVKNSLKNLRFLQPELSVLSFTCDDHSVMQATSGDPMTQAEKCASLFKLALGEVPQIILCDLESLLEKYPDAKSLQKHAIWLIKNDTINREELLENLIRLGYSKVSTVLDKGTFAARGSIIDIFPFHEKRPVRIDLFGDVIEHLKTFDETNQRSLLSLDSLVIGPAKFIYFDEDTIELSEEKLNHLADQLNFPTKKLNEKLRDINNGIYFYGIEKLLPAFFKERHSILDLLKTSETKIVLQDLELEPACKTFHKRLNSEYEKALLRNDLVFEPKDYFLDAESLKNSLKDFSSISFSSLDNNLKDLENSLNIKGKNTDFIRQEILHQASLASFDGEHALLAPLAKQIKNLHQDKTTVFIQTSSKEREKELKNLLQSLGLNLESFQREKDLKGFSWFESFTPHFRSHVHAFTLVSKYAPASGAIIEPLALAIISEEDIFGIKTKRSGKKGKQKGFSTSLSDLENDDFVVHVDHGVGQFKGLVRLNLRGVENDYILLHYAKDEKLYLPTHRINLIKAHGGGAEGQVKVDKLGGTAWLSKKSKVKEAVMAMAQDLLKLYAKRELSTRTPFMAPDAHYHDFEAAFAFEPTVDQEKAIDDVLDDMQKAQPMDRLVCGDVGYGKTEVAMRASMLAVLSKRQVAILAPTTVLAQQHGITFKERFKNTGANIAVISRFQSTKEIKKTILDLKTGQVDIVIGTHRLLSPDIEFKNLGLVVVDEEQRFGIKAKEHLKKMRTAVDILTMSATPIPRTMQMSYFGIRDLSIIETPPVDRRAIQTQIVQFDDEVIKEAILREISRGGQVYFVHNRVQSIEATKTYLQALVPTARIEVAHGQMSEDELEQRMLRFMSHEINLLVCTTIIETGIDVPTANTMFIDNADDFGLSQLYQLRGRIGRSKERAFAYLLVKTSQENLTPVAKARLEILHKFSELGAGFRIAQHDLELRGAGDLLGKSQHGHMAAVGYDLYAELLQEAVKELKGQTHEDAIDPEISLPVSALIPEKYCPDLHARMSFYQQLASANNERKIKEIIFDLEDQYGQIPDEVLGLKTSALLKIALKEIRGLKMDVALNKEKTQLSFSVALSPQSPVSLEKLQQCMKNSKVLKITPQQKIIQSLGLSSTDLNEAILEAGYLAIKNIKDEVLA